MWFCILLVTLQNENAFANPNQLVEIVNSISNCSATISDYCGHRINRRRAFRPANANRQDESLRRVVVTNVGVTR